MASPNMNLNIPSVGSTGGPEWATDLNSCLTIIDGHNHSSGSGVQITPSGININADFPLNNHNLTLVNAIQFGNASGSNSELYQSGVDLYYNDGSGNVVRLTQGGSVAGSTGSISGLSSPASASYSVANSTFVWQSDISTPASMDGASFIFRNLTANSKGVTVSAPAALASNYSLALPLLPASQKFMTLDNSGNMAAPWAVDSSTIEVNSNIVQVKAGGIGTSQLANSSVTTAKLANTSVTQAKKSVRTTGSNVGGPGDVVQASIDIATSSPSSWTTTGSVTLQTLGNPVSLSMVANPGFLANFTFVATTGNTVYYRIVANNGSNTVIAEYQRITDGGQVGYGPTQLTVWPATADTWTFSFQVQVSAGTVNLTNMLMIAYEL